MISQPNSLIVHWRNALNYIRWDRTGKLRTSNSSRRIASASRLHYALRAWHSYRHMDVRASRVKAQLLKLLRFWSAFNPFLMQIAPRTRCCGCLLNSTLTSHLAKSRNRTAESPSLCQIHRFTGQAICRWMSWNTSWRPWTVGSRPLVVVEIQTLRLRKYPQVCFKYQQILDPVMWFMRGH